MLRRLHFDRTEWRHELERRVRQLQAENSALLQDKIWLKAWLARVYERTMPDFPTATWAPASDFIIGHAGLKPNFIVLHVTPTAKSAEEAVRDHAARRDSVHYLVGHDGSVTQCVSEEHSSTGTIDLASYSQPFWSRVNMQRNPHFVSFVVEILADEETGKPSNEALASSFVLLKSLMERHNIPHQIACETGGITGHFSLGAAMMDGKLYGECARDFPYSALLDYLDGRIESIPLDTPEEPAAVTTEEEPPTEEAPAKSRKQRSPKAE